MSLAELSQMTAELQHDLEMLESLLSLYACELQRVVDAELQRTHELAQATARLQLLDRLKADFLTFISHELRTRLNGIVAINLLDPQGDPEEQAEIIALIRRSYERLAEFVQKGLEYFDWRGRGLVETSEMTDLTRAVQYVADHLPALTNPGADFSLFSPGIPCVVRGEECHLTLVMQVLLDNAVKFSQEHQFIRVEVRAVEKQGVVTVTDRGQGFAPELASELFQPFTIADLQHYTGGTGLNLALAHTIVTAYGGQIQAESPGIGQGATFTVRLPLVCLPERTGKG